MLSFQIAGIEAANQKLGKHYLKYVANYWNEKRLVKIVGRDLDYESKHWQGSDLRGNTDVRIQAGSALPFSKAAKQALVTEMMVNGWIAPQDGLEIMEFGGYEKVMEDFLVDKRSAQRENMKLAAAPVDMIASLVEPPVGEDGQPVMGPDPQALMEAGITPDQLAMASEDPQIQQVIAGLPEVPYDPETGMPFQPESPMPVNSWDNHEMHIHFHNQFRKTQQFELLEDPIKTAFELHVQAHQYALMSAQMGVAGPVADPATMAQEPGPGEEDATSSSAPGPVPGETEQSPSVPE
jgi:hypothetical protein